MNIMELGAIGELIGGVAVLATLLYLAVQVRHARSVVVETARSARFQGTTENLLFCAGDETWAATMAKIHARTAFPWSGFFEHLAVAYGIEAEEATRYQTWCFAWLKVREYSFFQTLDTGERSMLDAQVASFLSWPVNGEFWREPVHRVMFDERFVTHVDRLVARPRSS